MKHASDLENVKSEESSSKRKTKQRHPEGDLLHTTLLDAARLAYGIKMVELWVWDSSFSKLFRPQGGSWIDPYWHNHKSPGDYGTSSDTFMSTAISSCAFCQLLNSSGSNNGTMNSTSACGRSLMHSSDSIEVPSLSPGVGIPGVLWADLCHSTRLMSHKRQNSASDLHIKFGCNGDNTLEKDASYLLRASANRSINDHRQRVIIGKKLAIPSVDYPHQHIFSGLGGASTNASNDRISWRDIKALADDPDQPTDRNRSIQAIATGTDLRWAAAVYFKARGEEGIVVYYARASVNAEKLQNYTNTNYLVHASQLVGAAWALRIPREAAILCRRNEIARNFRHLRYAILALLRVGATLDDMMAMSSEGSMHQAKLQENLVADEVAYSNCDLRVQGKMLMNKVQQLFVKIRGGGAIAPPPSSSEQSFLSSLGVLFTLMSLGALNTAFSTTLDFGFPLAPMAALAALQYGLTSAPAAQPKTILIGQTVSIAVALVVSKIPFMDDVWLKQSFACALAVGIMARVCVVSPPAAANAYVFADGSLDWSNSLGTLIASLVAIFYAVWINNWSTKRQYPTYWGMIPPALQCMDDKSQHDSDKPVSHLDNIIRIARLRKGIRPFNADASIKSITSRREALPSDSTQHPKSQRILSSSP